MTATLRCLALLAASMAAPFCAVAQDARIPAGNWRSPQSATYTNPFLAGAELHLNIDVAQDGSFRGTWGQYLCNAYPGALGLSIISCSAFGGKPAAGRLGPDGQGTIELTELGRSAFTWTLPTADALAIDLPRTWHDSDALLYRARLNRDGKPKPAAPSATRDEGPQLSSIALYREFEKNSSSALARYAGKTLVLEGRRADLIRLSSGGAAIHIRDGYTRALVLLFPRIDQVAGIAEGAQFGFRCKVLHFDYQYVQMGDCAIVHR